MPKVSAILTVYNAASTVDRALRSLLSDVIENDGEIVVVDDGSTDDTPEVVRAFADEHDAPLRLFEPGRLGRADALNFAVSEAQADYVANLDADDISLPGRLAQQIAALDANEKLGMIGGAFIRVEEDLGKGFVQKFPTDDEGIRRSFAYSGPFCHSTVMYRRKAILEAGGFDAAERVRIDHHLWIRIGALGYQYANLDEPMAVHFKSGNTFFVRSSSERQLAANMFRRNRAAIQDLDLPAYLTLTAAVRTGFRFLPGRLRLKITPRTAPIDDSEVHHYVHDMV